MGCSDFHLFGSRLDGKRYARDSDVKRNVISRPHTLDTQFSYARIQTFSVSVFMLPYFSNFLVLISETSQRRHIQADGNLYSHHREKLKN